MFFRFFARHAAISTRRRHDANLIAANMLRRRIRRKLFCFDRCRLVRIVRVLAVRLDGVILRYLFGQIARKFLNCLVLEIGNEGNRCIEVCTLFRRDSIDSLFLFARGFQDVPPAPPTIH